LNIDDIEVEKKKISESDFPPDTPEEIKSLVLNSSTEASVINTSHKVFDEKGSFKSYEIFDLAKNESEGTQKLFFLAGPIINTLEEGKVLVCDEFDARLHPLITREIVKLFNSNDSNCHNAQLLIMTHDTNLLTKKLFRRDQIWFAEKTEDKGTSLYSLAEYRVRNDASYENDYIQGKYGAIPFIGNVEELIESCHVNSELS
jgi:hypothetical protein